MKKVLIFLGALAFVTQAHCLSKVLKEDFLVANDSSESISVAPIMKMGDVYYTLGDTAKIAPGKNETFKQFEEDPDLGMGDGNIAGLAISVGNRPLEFYAKDSFKGTVRFTDVNLGQFFDLNK